MGLHEQRAIVLRGDPGLFSKLGKALKGAAVGFITGGPLGAIRGAIGGVTSSRGPEIPPPGQLPALRGGGYQPALQHPLAGPAIVAGAQAAGIPVSPITMPSGEVKCPSGYRFNKSAYWTRAGYVPKRSKCVRIRSRNISNGRANTRAMSRIASWDKADRKRRALLRRMAR